MFLALSVLPTHINYRDKVPKSSKSCQFKFEALTFKYCCQKINKCRNFVTIIVVPLKTKINLDYREVFLNLCKTAAR